MALSFEQLAHAFAESSDRTRQNFDHIIEKYKRPGKRTDVIYLNEFSVLVDRGQLKKNSFKTKRFGYSRLAAPHPKHDNTTILDPSTSAFGANLSTTRDDAAPEKENYTPSSLPLGNTSNTTINISTVKGLRDCLLDEDWQCSQEEDPSDAETLQSDSDNESETEATSQTSEGEPSTTTVSGTDTGPKPRITQQAQKVNHVRHDWQYSYEDTTSIVKRHWERFYLRDPGCSDAAVSCNMRPSISALPHKKVAGWNNWNDGSEKFSMNPQAFPHVTPSQDDRNSSENLSQFGMQSRGLSEYSVDSLDCNASEHGTCRSPVSLLSVGDLQGSSPPQETCCAQGHPNSPKCTIRGLSGMVTGSESMSSPSYHPSPKMSSNKGATSSGTDPDSQRSKPANQVNAACLFKANPLSGAHRTTCKEDKQFDATFTVDLFACPQQNDGLECHRIPPEYGTTPCPPCIRTSGKNSKYSHFTTCGNSSNVADRWKPVSTPPLRGQGLVSVSTPPLRGQGLVKPESLSRDSSNVAERYKPVSTPPLRSQGLVKPESLSSDSSKRYKPDSTPPLRGQGLMKPESLSRDSSKRYKPDSTPPVRGQGLVKPESLSRDSSKVAEIYKPVSSLGQGLVKPESLSRQKLDFPLSVGSSATITCKSPRQFAVHKTYSRQNEFIKSKEEVCGSSPPVIYGQTATPARIVSKSCMPQIKSSESRLSKLSSEELMNYLISPVSQVRQQPSFKGHMWIGTFNSGTTHVGKYQINSNPNQSETKSTHCIQQTFSCVNDPLSIPVSMCPQERRSSTGIGQTWGVEKDEGGAYFFKTPKLQRPELLCDKEESCTPVGCSSPIFSPTSNSRDSVTSYIRQSISKPSRENKNPGTIVGVKQVNVKVDDEMDPTTKSMPDIVISHDVPIAKARPKSRKKLILSKGSSSFLSGKEKPVCGKECDPLKADPSESSLSLNNSYCSKSHRAYLGGSESSSDAGSIQVTPRKRKTALNHLRSPSYDTQAITGASDPRATAIMHPSIMPSMATCIASSSQISFAQTNVSRESNSSKFASRNELCGDSSAISDSKRQFCRKSDKQDVDVKSCPVTQNHAQLITSCQNWHPRKLDESKSGNIYKSPGSQKLLLFKRLKEKFGNIHTQQNVKTPPKGDCVFSPVTSQFCPSAKQANQGSLCSLTRSRSSENGSDIPDKLCTKSLASSCTTTYKQEHGIQDSPSSCLTSTPRKRRQASLLPIDISCIQVVEQEASRVTPVTTTPHVPGSRTEDSFSTSHSFEVAHSPDQTWATSVLSKKSTKSTPYAKCKEQSRDPITKQFTTKLTPENLFKKHMLYENGSVQSMKMKMERVSEWLQKNRAVVPGMASPETLASASKTGKAEMADVYDLGSTSSDSSELAVPINCSSSSEAAGSSAVSNASSDCANLSDSSHYKHELIHEPQRKLHGKPVNMTPEENPSFSPRLYPRNLVVFNPLGGDPKGTGRTNRRQVDNGGSIGRTKRRLGHSGKSGHDTSIGNISATSSTPCLGEGQCIKTICFLCSSGL